MEQEKHGENYGAIFGKRSKLVKLQQQLIQVS